MENHVCKNRTWGVRKGHTAEVVENIKTYLETHSANYFGQMDTLLDDYSGALWFFRNYPY